jgi:hypothetical protein
MKQALHAFSVAASKHKVSYVFRGKIRNSANMDVPDFVQKK